MPKIAVGAGTTSIVERSAIEATFSRVGSLDAPLWMTRYDSTTCVKSASAR